MHRDAVRVAANQPFPSAHSHMAAMLGKTSNATGWRASIGLSMTDWG
jgi:hypothetical protein